MDLDAVAIAAGVAAFVELRLAVRGISRRVAKLEKDRGDGDSGMHRAMRMLPWALLVPAFLLLGGCSSTRTSSASVERTTGRQGDQVVDLTTVRREQSEAQTGVELGPVVQAAVAAATGDLRGAIRELAARPPAPSSAELEAMVDNALADLPRAATPSDVERLVSGVAKGAGMDPTAAAGLGGAGGLALLALREWLAHRRTRESDDEAWGELKRLAMAKAAAAEDKG